MAAKWFLTLCWSGSQNFADVSSGFEVSLFKLFSSLFGSHTPPQTTHSVIPRSDCQVVPLSFFILFFLSPPPSTHSRLPNWGGPPFFIFPNNKFSGVFPPDRKKKTGEEGFGENPLCAFLPPQKNHSPTDVSRTKKTKSDKCDAILSGKRCILNHPSPVVG